MLETDRHIQKELTDLFALSRAAGGSAALTLAAALLTVTITPGMSTLALARASAVTYGLFRLSKLRLTSKDYLHIVRTYSPSWDYQANIKKDTSG